MKKSCPTTTKQQCVWWEVTAITVLVFVAVYAIVSRLDDWSFAKELLISTGATCAVLWSLWVVRTFRNIMTWWIDIQHKVDSACHLLNETKHDIKEIKLINQTK